ncbi:MAG TPA: Ig-like domain-containing protein, partial [Solirubrobacteraceae bacterium]|nr:Ig-like domain-containing protein [Solirubrobacteraceae bacterium]
MKAIGRLARTTIAAALLFVLAPAANALAEAPAVTLTSPAAGSSVATHSPAFSGATNDLIDEVTLRIYAGTSVEPTTLVETVTTLFPPTGGSWSLEPTTPLPDGTYTAQASQTNLAAETGTSEAVTFNVDTTPPAVSLSPVTSPTNDPTPTFGGAAGTAPGDDESVTLQIYAGSVASGSPVRTIPVTPHGGAWSATPAEHLGDGTYTAQAEQSDQAGNTGKSAASTFIVDTTPPAVSLTPVGSPTNHPTPSFEGNAGVASGDVGEVRLNIYAGGTATGSPIRTVAVTPLGASWSTTLGEALADGTYTAQAEQADEAGNVGKSAPSTFTIDTTPPMVQVTSPANGSFINSVKPVISGTAGNASGDQPTVTVKIYEGATVSGSPTQTLGVTRSGGSWSTGGSGPQLAEGTYTLQAEQSDEAGNTGTSAPSTFTIKTKGPAVSLTPVTSPTNDPTPSFGGGAGVAPGDIAAVTLKIYSGAEVSGVALRTVSVAPSGGTWGTTLTPGETLPDGTYTAQAEQSDEAGDTSTSAPSTFKIDTTPPTVQITSPANGSFINSVKPVISGTAGNASGTAGNSSRDEPTVTVKVYEGSAVSGSPAQTLALTRSGGSWSTGGSGPQLAEGTYTLQAEQSDEAGNTGTSAPSTFTIKTNLPAVSLTPLKTPTNDATPSFGGGAGAAPGDIASVTLKVYSGTKVSGSPLRT